MAIERTAHPYIVRDSTIYGGEPIVEGTRTGVRHIVLLFQSGQDPEEIAVGQHLSLAQVYDAISDTETGIDEIIAKSQLPTGKVSSTLLVLEMKRLVKQLPGQHFVKLV